ncbi:hypothetical protein GPECTOR_23g124 [Gonium pectorale]|uniref:RED-like N-terminal domain-containing protein n=1 Tax=Gonium pectorale TaxID=33097 RepID=A0A150GGV5_GONPE|nr:hypothetical protein GPECTOR_23g124 [Gonium pectorale]|eukprot:KXZ49037.1 hypothetical protein GPECTOR_23g124 [Gonium pectorale]
MDELRILGDRAEERRRGKNLDYEDASAVLAALAGGDGGASAGPAADLSGVDLPLKLSKEETKYLGGDMRFTHLVKGLDYALLHKTRNEITNKKGGPDDEDEEEDGNGAAAAGNEAARDAQARAAARANAASAAGSKQELRFSTPLARSVFHTLFQPPRPNVREMYQPRRPAFVYDFDNEDSLDTDIPTTLRRPKSECPPVSEALFAGVDNAVLDRIAKILSYVRTTADGKRLKRRDRDALLDDDIFGDAGTEYQPTNNKTKAKDAAGAKDQQARRPDGSYFETKDTMTDIFMPRTSIRRGGAAASAAAAGGGAGDDMELEEGEAGAPPPPPLPGPPPVDGAKAALYGQYGYRYDGQQQGYDQYGQPVYGNAAYGQGTAAGYGGGAYPGQEEAKARAADGDADDDAYAECYPGMAGFVGALVDSDDEGGALDRMDSKQAKGKTRADFATDEESHRYKESRETLPRAAFQYGVKRADGRKSHKELEKASEVRQIAGRAGRFSSAHPTGYVNTLHAADLPALHAALAEPPQPVMRACLLPSSEHLAAYTAAHLAYTAATSLLAFAAAAQLGPSYVYGNYEGM